MKFLANCNTTALIGESVLTAWWRGSDWSNKFDSVAIGTLTTIPNAFFYYVFDRSHIYIGPNGDLRKEDLQTYSLEANFWSRHYIYFGFQECLKFIEKIENLANEVINELCIGWATRLGQVDKVNSGKYLECALGFASTLNNNKRILRRELDLFFQGARLTS